MSDCGEPPVRNLDPAFMQRDAFKNAKTGRLGLMRGKIEAFHGCSRFLQEDQRCHTAWVVMGEDHVLGGLSGVY